jgi:hypothetical protein
MELYELRLPKVLVLLSDMKLSTPTARTWSV